MKVGLIDVDGHNFPNLALMRISAYKNKAKGMVYCLTNFNSTMNENLHRIYTLAGLGYDPYVMIYNKPSAPQEVIDLQRWCNNKIIFKKCQDFRDYVPTRKQK